jgi:hypothetical protein
MLEPSFFLSGYHVQVYARVSYADVGHWPKRALTDGPGDRGATVWVD